MKRLRVDYRDEAARDLDDIYRQVHEMSRDPVTAQRHIERMIDGCEKLGDMPHGGRPRDDLLPGLRTFPFEKRAVIAYRIEGKTIQITNVFYDGRDFEAIYRSGEPSH